MREDYLRLCCAMFSNELLMSSMAKVANEKNMSLSTLLVSTAKEILQEIDKVVADGRNGGSSS